MTMLTLAWRGVCRIAILVAARGLEALAFLFNGGSGWCARTARKLNDRAAFL
jgi:hypothetical protein